MKVKLGVMIEAVDAERCWSRGRLGCCGCRGRRGRCERRRGRGGRGAVPDGREQGAAQRERTARTQPGRRAQAAGRQDALSGRLR